MSKGLFIFTLVLVAVAVVGMMPVQGNAQDVFFQPAAFNTLSWGVPLAKREHKTVYEQETYYNRERDVLFRSRAASVDANKKYMPLKLAGGDVRVVPVSFTMLGLRFMNKEEYGEYKAERCVPDSSIIRQPWSVGVFGGAMFTTELTDNYNPPGESRLPGKESTITQTGGVTGGINVGYAFNDHLGLEARLHGTIVGVQIPELSGKLEGKWVTTDIWIPGRWVDTNAGKGTVPLPPNWVWVDGAYEQHWQVQPSKGYESSYRTLGIFDIAFHWYPWGGLTTGTRKWRPYIKGGVGFGAQGFEYWDSAGILTMPIGFGVRYWSNEHTAWQVDFVDNIIFGTTIEPGIKIKTTHNVALSIGLIYSWR